MKIYLDDIRPIPDGFVGCRTANEAIHMIKTCDVTYISFDHDLGEDKTGYDVACVIERLVVSGKIKMPGWNIHSANPVGAQRIKMALESAERFSK